ncbi:MAG: hypothetical protein HYU48_02700 [Candidatus Levybacteria bacterium]|nr:hypothetical protein [Candidatus Levybacteria bacterium]
MDDNNSNQKNQTLNVPVDQVAPSGSVQKEQEPVVSTSVKHSEPEPVISPELLEQGVAAVNQHVPNLPEDVRNAGVVHAKETNVPNLNSATNLPLTIRQAKEGKKSGVGNSLAWLSALVLKVLGR